MNYIATREAIGGWRVMGILQNELCDKCEVEGRTIPQTNFTAERCGHCGAVEINGHNYARQQESEGVDPLDSFRVSKRNPDHCYGCGTYIGGPVERHYCYACRDRREEQEDDGVVVEMLHDSDIENATYRYEIITLGPLFGLSQGQKCSVRLTRIQGG